MSDVRIFERGSVEFQMFADFYDMVKRVWDVNEKADYSEIVRMINAFVKRYDVDGTVQTQDSRIKVMAQKMAIAVIDYVEDARRL